MGCPKQVQELNYTLAYADVLDKAVRNSEIKRGQANTIIGYVRATGEEDPGLRQHTYAELAVKAEAWASELNGRLDSLKQRFEKGCVGGLATFSAEVERCLGATSGKDMVLAPIVKGELPDCRDLRNKAEQAEAQDKAKAMDAFKAAIQSCEQSLTKRKAWYDKEMGTKYGNKCADAVGGFGAAAYNE